MCINNMKDLAPSLNCGRSDMACLCKNMDFGFGVRDCAKEACPDDNLDKIKSTAESMCPNGGGGGGNCKLLKKEEFIRHDFPPSMTRV